MCPKHSCSDSLAACIADTSAQIVFERSAQDDHESGLAGQQFPVHTVVNKGVSSAVRVFEIPMDAQRQDVDSSFIFVVSICVCKKKMLFSQVRNILHRKSIELRRKVS